MKASELRSSSMAKKRITTITFGKTKKLVLYVKKTKDYWNRDYILEYWKGKVMLAMLTYDNRREAAAAIVRYIDAFTYNAIGVELNEKEEED